MDDPCIVLARDGAEKIAQSPLPGGSIDLTYSHSNDMYVARKIETYRDVRMPAAIPREYYALNSSDSAHVAQWMRNPSDNINLLHLYFLRRPGTRIEFDKFRQMIPGVKDPGYQLGVLITHDPDLNPEALEAGAHAYAGWLVQRSGVRPIQIEVEPDTIGIVQLEGRWPIAELATNSVMLVGCGSIGSAAAEAIMGYGVGRVDLVDPDRFLWHNIIRHTLGPASVGRFKVDALKDELTKRWPDQAIKAHAIDVVAQAHNIRAMIKDIDLVLCAADGIAPRRVISHLARRANKPALLACVLEHGAIGEILRLRPTPRFGCLLCLRQHLAARGAMDAEADQELEYGTGQVHRPMTAVPPDLSCIGTLAAKFAVATLLESLHGDHTQRLPAEHAIVGLRPGGNLVAPFDVSQTGEVRWENLPPPRATCFTCSTT